MDFEFLNFGFKFRNSKWRPKPQESCFGCNEWHELLKGQLQWVIDFAYHGPYVEYKIGGGGSIFWL